MSKSIHWETMTSEQRDALVAEKVFGRRVYRENTWGRWLLYRDDAPGLTEPLPRYTQSMDTAWLVVEKMSEIPTQPWEGELPPNTWFMHYFEKAALWACSAQEAAEEICKAALQAKGVDLTSQPLGIVKKEEVK